MCTLSKLILVLRLIISTHQHFHFLFGISKFSLNALITVNTILLLTKYNQNIILLTNCRNFAVEFLKQSLHITNYTCTDRSSFKMIILSDSSNVCLCRFYVINLSRCKRRSKKKINVGTIMIKCRGTQK